MTLTRSRREPDARFLILYAHGNKEDVSATIQFHRLVARPVGGEAVGFEYSGYGLLSNESPSEAKVYQNSKDAAEAAWLYASSRDLPLIVAGRSLGGAAAIAAAKCLGRRCSAVILQSVFTSALQTRVPRPIVKGLLYASDMFANDEEISALRSGLPVLIIHGVSDTIVPVQHAKRLAELRAGSELLLVVAGHNDMWTGESTRAQIVERVFKFLHAVVS